MRSLLIAAAWLALVSASGCRIEDHTPGGSRRDEEAVLELVARYARGMAARDWGAVRALFWREGSYSGPMVPRSVGEAVPIDSALGHLSRALDGVSPERFDVRVLRTDFRQDGDLAAAWVTTRRRTPLAGAGTVERDWVEHLVLRRIGNSWRILSVAGATAPRRERRGQL